MFVPEEWIIGESVNADTPAGLYIDALEDSVVIESSKVEHPEIDGLKLVKHMEVLQKRIVRLLSATAIERYEYFLETYPDMVQRVSPSSTQGKHVPSYHPSEGAFHTRLSTSRRDLSARKSTQISYVE